MNLSLLELVGLEETLKDHLVRTRSGTHFLILLLCKLICTAEPPLPFQRGMCEQVGPEIHGAQPLSSGLREGLVDGPLQGQEFDLVILVGLFKLSVLTNTVFCDAVMWIWSYLQIKADWRVLILLISLWVFHF